MQLENTIQNTYSNQTPHPNYKRIIILVAVIFIIIIAAAFAYQYFVNRKAEKARDLVLREQYRTEQINELEQFMAASAKKHVPLDTKTKQATIDFFAKAQPQPFTKADEKQVTAQSEEGYQNWKASQQ